MTHRLTGGTDVVLGLPSSARTAAQRRTPGMVSNMLPLRLALDPDLTLAQLVRQTSQEARTALRHRLYRHEQMRRDQGVPSGRRLCGPQLNLMPFANRFTFAGATATVHNLTIGSVDDLTVGVYPDDDGLRVDFDANPELYGPDEPAALHGAFLGLLRNLAAAEPDSPAAAIGMRSPAALSAGPTAPPPEIPALTLPDLFERSAARTPDATALRTDGEVLTYADVETRANRLARLLTSYGAGPGEHVALVLPRRLDLVVAILAVLKTGAAYVPVDPDYPAARVDFTLADAKPLAVVSSRATWGSLTGVQEPASPVLLLDAPDIRQSLERQPGDALHQRDRTAPLQPSHPAYVIYTSGSTGTPKGVSVTHGNVVSLLTAAEERFTFTADDRWTLFHSYAFDFSVWEIWGAFRHGGSVVVVPKDVTRDPRRFLRLLAEERVTVLNQTPSAFYELARAEQDDPAPGDALCLRTVVFGGEALDPARLAGWFERHPEGTESSPVLVNMYGITETTVHVTHRRLRAADTRRHDSVIGTGLPGFRLYVLDAALHPVPDGVVGELYVAGPQTAAGYGGRGALTAARFVADPFAGDGSRMYRTGDLARRTADGEFAYAGRADNQVKVRGFRIEPGEIQATIARHPAVAEAAVVARTSDEDDTRLVAYLVPSADAEDDPSRHEEIVDGWATVYDRLYGGEGEGGGADSVEFGEDFSGWNSSYGEGAPIPLPQMREWRAATVERIAQLGARRVLEIGVGSGLLLSRLAADRTEYWGTDLSRVVVERLARQVAAESALRGKVWLRTQPADDLRGLPEAHFDAVVLNSVVQYFPSGDYLLRVIEGAAKLLAPGGVLFIGDVRHRALLRTFRTAVHLERGGPAADPARLDQAIAQDLLNETELCLDPAFFAAAAHRVPGLAEAEAYLKHGTHHNELTRHRYDVILRSTPAQSGPPPRRLSWGSDVTTRDQLRRHLEQHDGALRIDGVPNARLAAEHAATASLRRDPEDVGEACAALSRPTDALDPDDLRELAEELGLQVRLACAHHGDSHTLDALFTPDDDPRLPLPAPQPDRADPREHANSPARAHHNTALVPAARAWCEEQLPPHMRPAAFVLLERLPLTAHGKVDQRALPAPDAVRTPAGASRAPGTERERALCALFAETLGVERVGPDDSFFDLGGHSLLATKLASRIRSVLGAEVEIRTLFENPTAGVLAQRLDGARTRPRPALVPQERPGTVPVSFAQRRMWFLQRMDEDTLAYNMPGVLRLRGPLDVGALERAFADVVERHESLRTIYPDHDGEPGRRLLPVREAAPRIETAQVDALPDTDDLLGEARTGFDLTTRPPLRVRLYRADAHDHLLLLVVHHIAADGWSLTPLLRDLASAYEARGAGVAPAWEPLPVQYADYTLWQRDLLGSEDDPGSLLSEQLDHWRTHLAGLPDQLALPFDRPRPAVADPRGLTSPVSLDATVHRGVAELARECGVSVFMVLQGAVAALLSKMGAGDDIPLGSPVAGRRDEALEDLVGFFVNTLVLRTDTSGNPTFRELLRRVRETNLAAHEHQDIPFERLVESLNPHRSPSRHPLFQVMLALQNNPEPELRLPGLEVELQPLEPGIARFDLTFSLTERHSADGEPAGIDGPLIYAAGLFDPATADTLVQRLHQLLGAVLTDPDVPLADLDVLTPAEHRRLRCGPVLPPVPEDQDLLSLLAAQATARPDAPALTAEDAVLTYAGLASRAEERAALLARHGVGPDTVVGIALPRGAEQVVTVFAVLRSGAACLALDPEHAGARTDFMLWDAAPVCVVTTAATAHVADGADPATARLVLDAEGDPYDSGATATTPPPRPRAAAGRAALVLYTSGSTGRPKGIVLTHGNVAGLVAALQHEMPLGHRDVVLHKSPLHFDAAVEEIFWPLLTGARLAVAPPGADRDPARLADLIRRYDVTTLDVVPAVLDLLTEELARTPAPSLTRVISAGDTLSANTVHRLHATTRAELVNAYGPAECTVNATTWTAPDPYGDRRPPIGTPTATTRAHVLDASLRPVPDGVVGELYLAGGGLARGYAGRPGLTAERFVADPFVPGARMYRTGDLARWNADGQLEFAGREDRQIKLRGVRIEPAEIEAALASHEAVDTALVVSREGREGRRLLVAYATTTGGEDPTAEQLRSHLRARLPEFMVPDLVTTLAEMPLTAHGKVDVAALPAPDLAPRETGRAPATSTELVLLTLFTEILQAPRIGVHDNFFDLGGHSLLATRLISRIRTELGVEIPLATLFGAPDVAALARRVEQADTARPALTPAARRPDPMPLSYAQQRMWFLERLSEGGLRYHLPGVLRLVGAVDAGALAGALRDVVGRHEVLRTVFPEVGGVPRQEVLPVGSVGEVLEVRDLPAAEVDAAIGEVVGRSFDLSCEVPLCAVLLRVGERESVLCVVLHHIAGDGWSLGPLLRDVGVAYEARREGRVPGWGPLPVQYADYTLWQRELLGSEADESSVSARQLAFWEQELSGLPDELVLPFDRPRPGVASHGGASVVYELSARLHRDMVGLARECGVSVFMVLQGAVAALLSRLGAGEDVPLGSPVAGRLDEALDESVGFFVNTLVLRTDTSGNPSFRELLGRVRERDLAAFAHQDVPFERLVEVLNPERSMARHPLFQVMLALNNTTQPLPTLPGIETALHPLETGTTQFDLAFDLREEYDDGEPAGIPVRLTYATDLFDPATAEKTLRRLNRLLEQVVDDPDQPVRAADILDGAERHQLLEEYNDTGEQYGDDAPVPLLFARQAAATPQAMALLGDAESLSYAELSGRVNRLARLLVEHGAGPEQTVAVALPRSTDLVVTLLAVWASGAAFLPLDLAYPRERLRFMAEDAGPVLLVTTGDETALPTPTPPRIRLDDEDVRRRLAALSDRDLDDSERTASLRAGHAAYLIYTSGSTGTPKGVVVTHAGLPDLAHSFGGALRLDGDSRCLQFSSISFDAAMSEIIPTLTAGAALVVTDAENLLSGEPLARTLTRHGVTHLCAPASVLDAHAAAAPLGELPRTLVAAGEACSGTTVALWSRERRMINAYGPTEHSVCVSMTGPLHGEGRPSIGRPLSNTRAYVLDQRLQPVPAGVVGELYSAGRGLARGYAGRPGPTAGRFVADPYGPPGTRMYRTGDLARWNAGGELEYMGRADEQIKVRGFRVEPGEIEAALTSHAAVTHAVVVAHGHRLVAYVEPAGDGPVEPREIREHLAGRLPAHLVPAVIVTLDALPLLPNRKLDRGALPAPDFSEGTSSRPPRDSTEAALCALTADVLDLPHVGIDDDFFALGGHSLLATRLVSKIRTRLGAEVSVRAVFEHPTVAALAARLHRRVAPRPALERRPEQGRVAPSYAQRRLWFLHQLTGASATYNIPMALRLTGPLDPTALRSALADVSARHEALRTLLVEEDGAPWQRVRPVPSPDAALTVREVTEDALMPALEEAAAHRFDLSAELPLRAELFRVAEDDHVLLVLLHHIAGDGWSVAPLTHDLAAAYGARLRTGEAPDWAPLPVQYADYSQWQRHLLGDADDPDSLAGRQLAYWRETLDGLPERVGLPVDRPHPATITYRGDSVPCTLEPGLHQAVAELGRVHHASVFMVLQAAFATLLSKTGAGDDIPVGTPVAGRTDESLEGLVGFFVNTLVLRTDTSDDPSFAELLERVRQTVLSAQENQDLPFEHLVEELNPVRDMAHHPLFQVMFAYHNLPPAALDMPGLDIEVQNLPIRTAKFDLHLELGEAHPWQGGTGAITGALQYNTDVFDRTTAEDLVRRLTALLETVTSQPHRRLSEIDILGEDERGRLLVTARDTARPVPATTLPQLFEEQAARTPQATAVVHEGLSLSYAELDSRADRLAHVLRDHGAGPERIVAVTLPRSPDLVVALLAVLKSGAAYLPLDLGLPSARIDHMLRDAAPVCAVTGPGDDAPLAERDLPTVTVDALSTPHTLPSERAHLAPGHPAYLLYTSGTTGTPKGVLNTHGALVNRLLWTQDQYGLGPEDRVLQKTSTGFDVSVWEFFWPLVTGATLVMARPEGQRDPAYLARVIEQQYVTIVHFVPSMLEEFLNEPSAARCTSLRHVLSSGEALTPELRDRALSLLPASLHNLYGPTEAAIDVTAWTCDPSDDSPVVPIGHPVWNTGAYVLDERLDPVGAGVVGELYISGAQLARGYVNRPALTAERFVADPFAGDGTRMYRTGDLARWSRRGALEHAGRADGQIKLHGVRVELGEIEAVLASLPGVGQAAAAVHRAGEGDARIAAYLVPRTADLVAGAESETGGAQEHVDEWASVYDELYRADGPDAPDGLETPFGEDFSGWNSSYDGEPVPLEEMREWRDRTVERVRELHARRVLEIGVGSGLLLSQLAADSIEYWGTDVSQVVVDRLARQVAASPELRGRVRLSARAADELSGLPAAHFDAVVLNSVVQYFPSADYLLKVLDGVAGLLAPGGVVFVGDVRHRGLVRSLRTAVHLGRGGPGADAGQIRQAVAQDLLLEKELLLDPAFFAAATGRLQRYTSAEATHKRGVHHNELTRYRYDVVLRTDATPPAPDEERTLVWGQDISGLDELTTALERHAGERIRLARVPNARTAHEVAAMRHFDAHGDVGGAVERIRQRPGVEIEDVHALGRGLDRGVTVTFAEAADDCFDAVFASDAAPPRTRLKTTEAAPGHFAGTPETSRLLAGLTTAARSHCAQRLPSSMVPSSFTLLDRLPVSRNGKLDREALPAPKSMAGTSRRAPESRLEAALCALFAAVVGAETVGPEDDFFDLGGHSLLAIRLISRIRADLGREVTVGLLFDAPTPAALATALDTTAPARPPLTPATHRPDPMPLSYAQQRMWFLQRIDGEDVTYSMPGVLRLVGVVDAGALAGALRDVVGRHEVLRTVFPEVGGVPRQEVLPVGSVGEVLEVRDVAASDVDGVVEEVVGRSFDLSCEVPLCAVLLRVGERESVLCVVLHHIAGDGWSLGPLLRDVGVAYEARREGRVPGWGPLPVQYADYTLWQRELLGSEADESSVSARQLAFWKQELSGLPDELVLPFDRPRPAVASHGGASVAYGLEACLHDSVVGLARECGVSVFMVLQGAVAALLSRLGAGEDVPLGSPVAGRLDEALDESVGFFVNTLVLRTDTSGNPSFRELLARIRERDLAAFAHQDVPFERLVEVLNPERSMARHPLFQVMLALNNTHQPTPALPGLEVSEYPLAPDIARFDLTVSLTELRDDTGGPAGIEGVLTYPTAVFDAQTVEALGRRLTTLLASVAASPDVPLGDIDLFEPAERDLLHPAHDAVVPAPYEDVVVLIGRQAVRRPDAVAVEYGDRSLTYRELDEASDRLAGLLVDRGARQHTTVAVALPRSPELIVALLAVLKTGAAYVPVDPSHPQDRIAYVLKDAEPVCCLGVEGALDALPPSSTLTLGALAGQETATRPAAPDRHPGPAPAALLYTSGTTGTPKGVRLTRSNVAAMVGAVQQLFRLDESDVVLHKSPLGFDASLEEIFWALATGARLAVAEPGADADPAHLARELNRYGVTTLDVVPAVLDALLDHGGPDGFPSLRRVLCAGDVLGRETVRRFHDTTPARLINLYGPTEATVNATYWRASTDFAHAPPIGTAVPGTRVRLLDDALRPVLPGVVAELYLAGDGVADGYLNRPGLSAERFVPDPFAADGQRMYRTGDLARWNRSGELEFAGRGDDQLKVRGVRIEPGEIEAVLEAHPSVRRAVVTERQGRLIAYLHLAEPGEDLDPDALRAHAGRFLPGHMLPAVHVAVPGFALTSNGKIDRRALPDPPSAHVPAHGHRTGGLREDLLICLFAEILELPDVGPDDNFFDLGGHSLLATRLTGRMHETFGVHVPLAALFDAPTPRGLVRRHLSGRDPSEQEGSTGGTAFAPLLRLREGEGPALFCVHPVAGLSWAYARLLPHLDRRVPVVALQARGLDGGASLPSSLTEMAQGYAADIVRTQPHGPYHLLGWSMGGTLAHEVAARLKSQGHEVGVVALLDAHPEDPPEAKGQDAESVEISVLRSLLDHFGLAQPAEADPGILRRALTGFLAENRTPLGQNEEGLSRLIAVYTNNARLARGFTPRRLDHDVLAFTATGEAGHPDSARRWGPFVEGEVTDHAVDCRHTEMLDAPSAKHIGRLLDAHLLPDEHAPRGRKNS
ncbi:hypothetical protein GCM10009801_18910 [Streptomyces albiaxialis]|uniref:Carrier domain-containing protein n=2 Tax=Streptomyces albiaxialis TaxID=329523 RepID=A0ABN2VQB6_9ACTN